MERKPVVGESFAGAPQYEVSASSTGALHAKPRTASFRREGVAAVFAAWSAAYEKNRLHADFNPPVSIDLADHAEVCAQIFLDLAAEIWPADDAIAALRNAAPSGLTKAWMPVAQGESHG